MTSTACSVCSSMIQWPESVITAPSTLRGDGLDFGLHRRAVGMIAADRQHGHLQLADLGEQRLVVLRHLARTRANWPLNALWIAPGRA